MFQILKDDFLNRRNPNLFAEQKDLSSPRELFHANFAQPLDNLCDGVFEVHALAFLRF